MHTATASGSIKQNIVGKRKDSACTDSNVKQNTHPPLKWKHAQTESRGLTQFLKKRECKIIEQPEIIRPKHYFTFLGCKNKLSLRWVNHQKLNQCFIGPTSQTHGNRHGALYQSFREKSNLFEQRSTAPQLHGSNNVYIDIGISSNMVKAKWILIFNSIIILSESYFKEYHPL